MKRLLCLALAAILLVGTLSGCGKKEEEGADLSEIQKVTGVDVSDGEVLSHQDSHGGFHGDGMTITAIQCSGDRVLNQVKGAPSWKAFPLDDTVQALAYGLSSGTSMEGPYLTDGEGNTVIPPITDGYYFFLDRHDSAAKDPDVLGRGSFNLTAAFYNCEDDTFYYCVFDT